MRLGYFSIANMVDWVIYLFSIGFVFNIKMPWEIGEGCVGNIVSWSPSKSFIPLSSQCWRWPVGSFILTVAWLNLLTYFQQLPSLGIFILMFKDVGFTMLKFLLIMFVFVIAFGLGFHILFKNNNVRWNTCYTFRLNSPFRNSLLTLLVPWSRPLWWWWES